jgi:hypothetical protein
MKNSDSDDADSGNRGGHTSSAGQPSGPGTAGHRSRVARDAAVAAGKETSERVAEAARKARAAALPGLSRAREDGARHWSEIDPDVKQQVALSLLTSAAVAAGERLKAHDRLGVRLVGLSLAAAAPAIATHAARQVGKVVGNAHLKTRSAAAEAGRDNIGSTDQTGQPEKGRKAGIRGYLPSPGVPEPAILSEYADAVGVRRPPDPEDLYREGTDTLELAYSLPEGLAALPWESLSRRDRFFVLVAAWALREADGIQLLKSGQLEQAREVFQECLVRAEQMQTPELAVRSYEDLGELSVVAGDEIGARKSRAEAERIMHR